MDRIDTREEWLTKAGEQVSPWIRAAGGGSIPKFRVSVGWPWGSRVTPQSGGKSHTIGQCFGSEVSGDGTSELFISPLLADPALVLPVLVHELVHAFVGVKAKHGRDFKIVAIKVGLAGRMTATHAGDELKVRLAKLATDLGEFPHAAMSVGNNPLKPKQGTRMLKLECPSCGYAARTTQKWLDVGIPTCVCGIKMVGPGSGEKGDNDDGA